MSLYHLNIVSFDSLLNAQYARVDISTHDLCNNVYMDQTVVNNGHIKILIPNIKALFIYLIIYLL